MEPPSSIPDVDFEVLRGEGGSGGCLSGSSCHGTGTISLFITPPADDATVAEDMGYRIVLIEGDLPGDMENWLLQEPVRGRASLMESQWSLVLHWDDGGPDKHESIDFTIDIIPMDLAGNEGPAYRIRVRDSGSDTGCSLAGRSSGPLGLLVLMLLLVAVLRAASRQGFG